MEIRLCACPPAAHNQLVGFVPTAILQSKEITMKWEAPKAVDMRWGFEITMYIANR